MNSLQGRNPGSGRKLDSRGPSKRAACSSAVVNLHKGFLGAGSAAILPKLAPVPLGGLGPSLGTFLDDSSPILLTGHGPSPHFW
jgi:hypothetical protein